MKLHIGDMIVVISGRDKGKTGRVLRVLLEEHRIVVAGINMRTRHVKKTAQGPGRQVRFEASLAASNVMLLDPKTKKPTRIGYRFVGEGSAKKKERVARASGEVLLSGRKLRKLLEDEMAVEDKKSAKESTPSQSPTPNP